MIQIEGRVMIREDGETALAYLADFRNLPRWDPGIAEVRQTEGDGPAVGARYLVVARFLGARVPMQYRTERFDAAAGVAEVRGESRTLEAVDRITVRARPEGGCEVHWQADFQFKGLGRLAERAMKPLFDRLGRKAMDGLRAKLG